MNLKLKKEIIKHIFNKFNLFKINELNSGFIENLLNEKFVLPKKIVFENEENKKYENIIFGAEFNIKEKKINILVADLKEDNTPEYALLFKMDNLPTYALRLSATNDDNGSLYINYQDNWVDGSTAVQSKFLLGIENISNIVVEWKRLDKYDEMYKLLIDFLNFYEKT